MTTLQEMSERALARGAGYPAIEWEKRWINWEEMRHVAGCVNALVAASRADPRAPVAMVPRNRPNALAALLGLIATGRNISMIHVYQTPPGVIRDILRLKPAVVIIAAEDFAEEIRAVLREQGIAGIALTGMGAEAIPGCERSTAACHAPAPHPQIDLLTSGTTGPPKQFALGYDMIATHMVGANMMPIDKASDPAKLTPLYMYLPFGNFSGIYATLPTLLLGLRAVLVDRFSLASCLDYIVRYRPVFVGTPTAALQMMLETNVPREDLASLRSINTGASPLDPTVQRAFEERYGIPVLLAYGATEFGGPVSLMTLQLYPEWGKKKFGSVGRPFGGAQLRVVDPETGAVLPPGKEGLLEAISPRIGPHWIRTTDLAVLDEDGFLFHKGRADGAIMRGGFKLLPDTIERALKLHEAVSAAGVTGVPDKRLGQVPAAAVQLKPGAPQPTIAEFEEHLRNHVEATHIPVKWLFVETLPYTPMMKVDRAALSRLFTNG
jgi:long-chain acyl-CoA synthetase